MSPDNARVFIAEDDSQWNSLLKELVEMDGHTVVSSASSLPDAQKAIPTLNKDKVDVAILDGNLNEYDTNGNDGRTMLKSIREHAPNVKIVGMSGNKMPGTDVDLGKGNAVDIGKTISNL